MHEVCCSHDSAFDIGKLNRLLEPQSLQIQNLVAPHPSAVNRFVWGLMSSPTILAAVENVKTNVVDFLYDDLELLNEMPNIRTLALDDAKLGKGRLHELAGKQIDQVLHRHSYPWFRRVTTPGDENVLRKDRFWMAKPPPPTFGWGWIHGVCHFKWSFRWVLDDESVVETSNYQTAREVSRDGAAAQASHV